MSDLTKVVQKLTETNARLDTLSKEVEDGNSAIYSLPDALSEVIPKPVASTGNDGIVDGLKGMKKTDIEVQQNTKEMLDKQDQTNKLLNMTADEIRYQQKTNSDLVMQFADDAIAGNADAISELRQLQKDDGGLVTEQLTQEKLDELLAVLKLANNKENKREGFKAIGESIKSALGKTGLFGMMKSIGGYFSGLAKSAGKGALNILKTLGLAAGLGLLITVLESDMLKKFLSVENIERFRLGIKRFVDSVKKVFDAFFGPEGGFFKGIRTLGEELGLIEKETDDANKTLLSNLSTLGIAATIIAIGGSFLLLKKGFTALRNMVTGQTSKTLKTADVTTGGGKPGTVNKMTGRLIGADGKDTTLKKGDKGFKKAQQNVKKISGGAGSKAGKIAKGIFKRIPAIGLLFGISDILNIASSGASPKEMTEQIAGVLGGLGGSVLGAIAGTFGGGLLGGPIGAFIGGIGGGAAGYFIGEEIALGAAQFLTGQTIDAFDGLLSMFSGNKGKPPPDMVSEFGGKASATKDKKFNVDAFAKGSIGDKNARFRTMGGGTKGAYLKLVKESRGIANADESLMMVDGLGSSGRASGGGTVNNFNTITQGGNTTNETKTIMSKSVNNSSISEQYVFST